MEEIWRDIKGYEGKYQASNKSISDLARKKGINVGTVLSRLHRGWTLEEAIEILKYVNLVRKFSGIYSTTEIIHEAIETILDLYNKEKEENKKLSEKLTEQICNKVEVEVLEEYRLKLKNSISKDKIKEFYKKYLAESMKNFSPYVKDESTPKKERKAGQLYILYNLEKELLEEEE